MSVKRAACLSLEASDRRGPNFRLLCARPANNLEEHGTQRPQSNPRAGERNKTREISIANEHACRIPHDMECDGRSEERRVGKERRCGRVRCQEKGKT